MCKAHKSDFYYGSFLSQLINNGKTPAIVESEDRRSIYSLTTDKGNYTIYSKYVSTPRGRDNSCLWNFIFTKDEVEAIKHYKDNGRKFLFALICGKKRLQESEFAVLTLDEARDCLGFNYTTDTYRLTIKYEKRRKGLGLYGTSRSDRNHDGSDNTLRISREVLLGL